MEEIFQGDTKDENPGGQPMTARWVSLAVVVAALAACSREGATGDMAALDKAYKAGVLSPDEYAAKKAALQREGKAIAALDKALAAGVLTKDEYLAKKSALLQPNGALLSSTSSPAESAPALVESAPSIEKEGTAAKPAATGNPQPSSPAPQAASSDGHTYHMKMVKIMDNQGFERPMVSATLLIPTDWEAQGATTWNIKD